MGGPRRTMYPAFVLAVFSFASGVAGFAVLAGVGVLVGATIAPTPIDGNTRRRTPRAPLSAHRGPGVDGRGSGHRGRGGFRRGRAADRRARLGGGFASVAAFGCAAALIAVGSLARLRRADTRAAAFDASIGERDTIVDEGTGTPLAPLRRMLPPCRGMDASTNLRSSAERAI